MVAHRPRAPVRPPLPPHPAPLAAARPRRGRLCGRRLQHTPPLAALQAVHMSTLIAIHMTLPVRLPTENHMQPAAARRRRGARPCLPRQPAAPRPARRLLPRLPHAAIGRRRRRPRAHLRCGGAGLQYALSCVVRRAPFNRTDSAWHCTCPWQVLVRGASRPLQLHLPRARPQPPPSPSLITAHPSRPPRHVLAAFSLLPEPPVPFPRPCPPY